MSEPDTTKKRDRISKACQFCRSKKIKCDGATPCSHCKTSNNSQCFYPSNTERKPRTKKSVSKSSKSQNVGELEDRLGRLESLLSTLTDKMVPGGSSNGFNSISGPVIDTPQMQSVGSKSSDGYDESEDSSKEFSGGDYLDRNLTNTAYSDTFKRNPDPPSTQYGKTDDENGYDDTKEDSNIAQVFHISDHYYGSHSNFNIFSNKSLEWIFTKLPKQDSELLTPMGNLPIMFNLCLRTFKEVWFAPRSNDEELKRRLVEGWFPEDQSLVFDLIDCFDGIFLASDLCDSQSVRELFRTYYLNKKEPNPNRFKFSELLIMNISLALCISSVIDKRMSTTSNTDNSNGRTPNLFAYSTGDLIHLQTRFFSSSIYYYDMINVMSDGIKTIQAILLLIIYLETSWVKSTVNYILASIAVRFAQEIGLHRAESFVDLPLEEANFRRKIWWFCEYFDMEVCYRNGKPPLINPADVSTGNSKDIVDTMVKNNIPVNQSQGRLDELDPVLLSFILENKGFNSYIGHFLSVLTRIRAKSYSCLFSASSCNQSFKSIVNNINEINSDMFSMAEAISPSLKPRFYNDPDFNSSLIFSKQIHSGPYSIEIALTFHLTYFTHFMTVNRLISQIDNIEYKLKNREVLKFRNLALDSTRTILHIIRKLDRNSTPFSCINWSIFYPFGAFLTLLSNCLNRPQLAETADDINLLVDVSVNFFAFQLDNLNMNKALNSEVCKIYNQRESVSFIICTLMLNIGMRIIDSESDYNFVEDNSRIRGYLKNCEEVFPELFKRNKNTVVIGCAEEAGKTFHYDRLMGYPERSDPSSASSEDTVFTIPAGMLPGPTGYLTIPFEKPVSRGVANLQGQTPQSYGTSSFGGNDPANESSPGGFQRNSLSSLLQPTGTTPMAPFDANIAVRQGSFANNAPTPSKHLFSGFGLNNDGDINDSFERIFQVGSPNFFFDNNIGLQ